MTEQLVMNDEKDVNNSARKAGIRRHALALAGVAFAVFVSYIVYVFVYTTTN